MASFEMESRDGLARLGRLFTPHGTVRTPALLPVIHPGQMLIPPAQMRRLFGAEMVITNSYIIRGRPEFRERALRDGVGALIGFDGPVMTDSGTFQSFMYGGVEVGQLEILDFQLAIGSDLCTMLDLFSEPDISQPKACSELEVNIGRAKEAARHFAARLEEGGTGPGDRRGSGGPGSPPGAESGEPGEGVPEGGGAGRARAAERQGLVLTVQGGVFPGLRERSAREIAGLECAVQAIGGVVPLMESYRFPELVEVVLSSRRHLRPSRPVHLFGAGHPMLFALAALMGCDMFDSASYAKYAKDGRMMFPDCTRRLDELSELPCSCPVCSANTPEKLRALAPDERTRLLAEHNLHVSFGEMRAVRQAISDCSLWELVEERCRAHPSLLSALAVLGRHADYLERHAPLSRPGAFFYKGPESSFRPEVLRWSRRVAERYRMPESELTVCLPEAPKPYSRHYRELVARLLGRWDARFVISSFFGPVPLELDGMYPISQSLVPQALDPASVRRISEAMKEFSHRLRSRFSLIWEGEGSLSDIEMLLPARLRPPMDLERARVEATADMQFGAGAASALLNGKVELVTSPNTGRVRNVLVDGQHVLSLRAGDGCFSLRLQGGERLRRAFPPPALRVVVDADVAEYAARGRNVFARFVRDCDPALRPMDEVVVVDGKDSLVAVGRALMVREEMLDFKRGMAVRVRQGLRGGDDTESGA